MKKEKLIKGKQIPHIVDEKFYNQEFTEEEVELMEQEPVVSPENINWEEQERIKENLKEAVLNTKRTRKAITIKIFEDTLTKIKIQAYKEGIPYQTLITSILHKNFK